VIPAICIFGKPSHGTISIIKNERHEIRNNIYPIVLTIDHYLSDIRITKIRIIGLILPQISGVSEQLRHQAMSRREGMKVIITVLRFCGYAVMQVLAHCL
jgi:hypothetical protein